MEYPWAIIDQQREEIENLKKQIVELTVIKNAWHRDYDLLMIKFNTEMQWEKDKYGELTKKIKRMGIMAEIELGDRIKDIITDATGVVMAKAVYLTGHTTFGIQFKSNDGTLPDLQWVEPSRIFVLSGDRVTLRRDV